MPNRAISKALLSILACPVCKSSLDYKRDENKLICSKCKQIYEIKDNIPILMPK